MRASVLGGLAMDMGGVVGGRLDVRGERGCASVWPSGRDSIVESEEESEEEREEGGRGDAREEEREDEALVSS